MTDCTCCNISTGGAHKHGCPNGPEPHWVDFFNADEAERQPWQCPQCKVVYAPWVNECRCEAPVRIYCNVTTTMDAGLFEDRMRQAVTEAMR